MSSLTSSALFAPVMPDLKYKHNLERNLSAYMRTHGCSEATVDLENGEFVENGRVIDLLQLLVRHDLVGVGRVDLIPVAEDRST